MPARGRAERAAGERKGREGSKLVVSREIDQSPKPPDFVGRSCHSFVLGRVGDPVFSGVAHGSLGRRMRADTIPDERRCPRSDCDCGENDDDGCTTRARAAERKTPCGRYDAKKSRAARPMRPKESTPPTSPVTRSVEASGGRSTAAGLRTRLARALRPEEYHRNEVPARSPKYETLPPKRPPTIAIASPRRMPELRSSTTNGNAADNEPAIRSAPSGMSMAALRRFLRDS
jgi:hypothetical protein